MARSAVHSSWALIALGGVLGLMVAAGLRAAGLDDDGFVPLEWSGAVGLAVALAACVLSWQVRSPAAHRSPKASSMVVGGALASLAIAVWLGLGNDVIRFHSWEHFHYYLGAKYFPELSYARLYGCTAVAEAERVGVEEMDGRRMRDLAADEVVSVAAALARPDDCKHHFTASRWRAFGDDVMFFREALGGMWDRMQQDHGYNPPPTWALAGGLLASIAPASVETQSTLALIDPLLLAAMLGMIGWAFGAHVLLVAIVVWACQVPGAATWTTGAFLRQDWLFCLVAGVCCARRGWPALAGIALASSAALRVFPALLLVLPLVVIVRRSWRHGRLSRFDSRFLAGLAGAACAWFAAVSLVYGLDAWRAFAAHLAVHRMSPLANHVGLRAAFSQSWDGRWVEAMRPGTTDPFAVWVASRRDTFAAWYGVYVAVAVGIGLVTLAAGWRIRRLWTAIAAASVLVLTAVDLASYYCAFLIVLGLLAASSRVQERLALAAIVVSRAIDLFPIATQNPDYRYVVQGEVSIAWALTAAVLLAWRPRAGLTQAAGARRHR